jgi:hypothetical protein
LRQCQGRGEPDSLGPSARQDRCNEIRGIGKRGNCGISPRPLASR